MSTSAWRRYQHCYLAVQVHIRLPLRWTAYNSALCAPTSDLSSNCTFSSLRRGHFNLRGGRMAARLPLLGLLALHVLGIVFAGGVPPCTLAAAQQRCRGPAPVEQPPPLLRRVAQWGAAPNTSSTVTVLAQSSFDRRGLQQRRRSASAQAGVTSAAACLLCPLLCSHIPSPAAP